MEAASGHVAEDGAGVGGEELEALGAGGAAAAVEGVGEHDFEVGELEGGDVVPGVVVMVAILRLLRLNVLTSILI